MKMHRAIETPLREIFRRHLHEALDELIDAGPELDEVDAAAVNRAFVTLLRISRMHSRNPETTAVRKVGVLALLASTPVFSLGCSGAALADAPSMPAREAP